MSGDLLDSADDKVLADVMRRLITHLQNRTDVQNISLMELSGFCRNCLSKWYYESSKGTACEVSIDEAKMIVYGMDYVAWKKKYQI